MISIQYIYLINAKKVEPNDNITLDELGVENQYNIEAILLD